MKVQEPLQLNQKLVLTGYLYFFQNGSRKREVIPNSFFVQLSLFLDNLIHMYDTIWLLSVCTFSYL